MTLRKLKQWSLILCTALIALTMLAPQLAAAGDAPGELSFKAHNKMYNAAGKFETWHFTKVDIPGGDLEKGSVEFEVDLASVSEKAADLAAHLRTADFFDVAKFTTATVKIDRAQKTGEGTYEAVATVDLHGHTGEVPAKFKVVSTSPLTIKGSATLDRTTFGIGGPYDAGNDRSIVAGIEINISATVE